MTAFFLKTQKYSLHDLHKLSVTLCKKLTRAFALNTQTTNTHPSKKKKHIFDKLQTATRFGL